MKDFEEENIPIGPLSMIVGVATCFVIVVIFVLTGLESSIRQGRLDAFAREAAVKAEASAAIRAERTSTYGVLDNETGKVQIPVERAMELVTEERKSD